MPEEKMAPAYSTVEELLNSKKLSAHVLYDRICRLNHIEGTSIVDVIKVEDSTKCKYGPVFHYITDKAEDILVSEEENKVITVLICRPNQLRRLYQKMGEEVPRKLYIAALVNELLARNI